VDKRIVSGATILCLIFGILDGVFVWQDWTITSGASATPQDIRLADLAVKGPGGNKHVHVTEAHFGQNYAVETKNGKPNRAWVPLVGPDGLIKVVVKTFNADDASLNRLTQQTTVTGIITNDIHPIGSAEINVLKKSYPNADFENVLILEEGRAFPSQSRMYALLAGAIVLFTGALVSGVLWVAAVRRERRIARGEVVDAAPAAPAEMPPSAAALGAFQRSYTAAPTVRKFLIAGGLFLVLIAGGGAMALTHTNEAEMPLGVGMVVGAAVLLVAGVAYGIYRVSCEVLLFADGLIEKRRGAETLCRWDEVEALTGMVPTNNQFGMQCYVGGPLVLTRRDGKRLVISDGLQDFVPLTEYISAEVLKRLRPAARAAMDRGETVGIGPLRVDRFGVSQGDGDTLPWGEVSDVGVVDDWLMIHRAGKEWFRGKLEKTPNAVLMLELASDLQQQT
jgi:hypothetical protein